MSSMPGGNAYTCPYCRMTSQGDGHTCSSCGAPIDIRLKISSSGWVKQPAIRDMARIRFNRSTCQISGMFVPAAEMKLDAEDWVYFSHHSLLHADSQVRLEAIKMAGGWNRRLAGIPLIMMKAQGPGFIAFSANRPGETLAIPLQANQSVDVVEHRLLLATGNIGYQWNQSGVWFSTKSGDDTETHYPLGRFLDRFTAHNMPGLLLLHGPGNSFVRDLAPGQRILVQPGALIWKDPSVQMFLHFEYPRGRYWFSSARWQAKSIWLTLQGPGRIAIQSAFHHLHQVGSVYRSSNSTRQQW
ncbi:MAG TPA: AIM24 family protein [Streptosporangiaceae bacterium]|nr:AIM24 family protein [Streptosporangiaceae bacterium]